MTAALLLHRADGAVPSTAFRKAALGPTDPFAREREIAWQGPGAMSAGRVGFAGDVDVAHYPHTETLVVVEGELSLTSAGAAPLVLRRGDGAVIARGTAVRIQAASRTLFVFCATAAERANQPGITPLRADANFKPSNSLPPEVLLGPAPVCRSDNVFKDELTGVQAGAWDSTPYHRTVRPHRVNDPTARRTSYSPRASSSRSCTPSCRAGSRRRKTPCSRSRASAAASRTTCCRLRSS
jgi:uncharacterized cupin superfamily protein